MERDRFHLVRHLDSQSLLTHPELTVGTLLHRFANAAVATLVVKDYAFKTYATCGGCYKLLCQHHRPQSPVVVRRLTAA